MRICSSSLLYLLAVLPLRCIRQVAGTTAHPFWRPRSHSFCAASLRGGDGGTEGLETSDHRSTSNNSSASTTSDSDGFTILNERILYDNWRRVIQRRVKYPQQNDDGSDSGLEVDFELVAQKGTDCAVLIVAWNTQTKTGTLVREYMPSVNRMQVGFAAGMVETDKHGADPTVNENSNDHGDDEHDLVLTAAQHELEEECQMTGGTWILLTPPGQGIVMDKYSTTRLSVYLVLDATILPPEHAKPRDETEQGMHAIHGVTHQEMRELVATGQMTVVGSWTCLLALDKLRELGEIE